MNYNNEKIIEILNQINEKAENNEINITEEDLDNIADVIVNLNDGKEFNKEAYSASIARAITAAGIFDSVEERGSFLEDLYNSNKKVESNSEDISENSSDNSVDEDNYEMEVTNENRSEIVEALNEILEEKEKNATEEEKEAIKKERVNIKNPTYKNENIESFIKVNDLTEEVLETRIKIIDKQIKEIELRIINSSVLSEEKEYRELKKRIEEVELNPEDMMYPEFERDKKRLAELEKEINNLPETTATKIKEEYRELKKKIEEVELNPEDMMYPEFERDKKRLAELEKEISNLPETKIEKLKEKYAKKQAEYVKLKKKIEEVELNPEDMMYPEFERDKKRLAELEKETKEIEKELNILTGKNITDEERKKLEELYKKKAELEKALEKVRNKKSNESQRNSKPTAKEKKYWLQGIMGAAVGLTLGVTLAGTAATVATFGITGVTIVTNAIPIANKVSKIFANSKMYKKHLEKEGKETGSVDKIIDITDKVINNKRFKQWRWFINGTAIGFGAGRFLKNTVNLLKKPTVDPSKQTTTSDIGDKPSKLMNGAQKSGEGISKSVANSTNNIIDGFKPLTKNQIMKDPSILDGLDIDLSGIEGYTSSDASKGVSIIKKLAKHADIVRSGNGKFIRGEKIITKSLDGDYLAWYDLNNPKVIKAINEALKKTAKVAAKGRTL